jgi:hypothetical protein
MPVGQARPVSRRPILGHQGEKQPALSEKIVQLPLFFVSVADNLF